MLFISKQTIISKKTSALLSDDSARAESSCSEWSRPGLESDRGSRQMSTVCVRIDLSLRLRHLFIGDWS